MSPRFLAAWLLTLAAPAPGPSAAQEGGGANEAAVFEQALAAHPYFSHLALERDASHAPYLFLLQKSGGEAPPALKKVPELVALLDPLLERFETRIAKPLGLEPRADRGRFVVVVLASRGDLENYQRVTRGAWHFGARALFDEQLDAAVLYEDPFQPGRSSSEVARSARHALVHACQEAWYSGGEHVPIDSWLMEGMADALSAPGSLDDALRPDGDSLRQFVADALDEKRCFADLRTLEELFFVSEPARLGLFFQKSPPALQKTLDTSQSWWAFEREASLVFAFLWARHRAELVAFLGHALAGRGTMASFQASFTGIPVPALEGEFLGWVLEQHHAAFPVEKPDRERVLAALRRGSAPPAEPPPPRLELEDATPEERLALSVYQLAHGLEEPAAQALAALAGEPLDAALHERVLRERRRLEAWCALREAYLRGLVASGTALEFQHEGKSYKAKLLALEGRELVLEKNRSGLERLPIAALDALALAQVMRPAGGANDWARLVPYVLREDPRAKKLLKDDGGEGSALSSDAREDYPARLRLGAAMARLAALAGAREPETPAETEARLGELADVRRSLGELALVQRKEPELLALARSLLQKKYALADEHTLLNGAFEALPGGSVRITYDLKNERLLEDFEASLYPVLFSKGFQAISGPDQPFHVENGELVARGKAGLRSLFDLGAPLAVHYKLAFSGVPGQSGVDDFAMGCADDGQEHFVWGLRFSCLQAVDQSLETVEENGRYFLNTVYDMQLRHDGTRVTLACEGQEASIAAGARTSGAIFLRANTEDPVRIAQLVIEGRLLPESFARLRRQRVERDLARL